MIIKTMALGDLGANCYIVSDNNNDAIIIDPGTTSKRVYEYIEANNLNPLAVLVTHGHFDHVGGVDKLCNKFNIDFYMNHDDLDILNDSFFKNFGIEVVDTNTKAKNLDEGILKLNNFNINCIQASGHSKGCTLLQIDNNIFTGDVLFKECIGRTDLKGSSNQDMKKSLEIIKMLDNDLIVYPGHGPSSSIKEELENNPYLR